MHPPSAAPALKLETDGPVGWLVIDNAVRMNALTIDMWRKVPELVRRLEEDPAIRVIVVRGAGDTTFSSGADISEFETRRSGPAAKEYDALNDAAFSALSSAKKPSLAMIRGYCLGGALGLATCCDLRVADETAQFAIPAARLGIAYNPRWVRQLMGVVSPAYAKEILFTARRFTALEAQSMGLVNRIFPPAELEERTRALAQLIAGNAPLSIAAAKRTIEELARPETADMARLDALVEATWSSEDYAEGQRAFREKRKPTFRGR